MSARRGFALGAGLLAAAVAVALAPQPPAGQPGPPLPVAARVLVCPELTVTDDSASVVSGVVGQAPDHEEGPANAGSASLADLAGGTDLARVSGPDRPATLLLAEQSQPPLVFRAQDAWAGEALAGVAGVDQGGIATGLASAACPEPDREWWFVGAGSQIRRGAALLIANPSDEPARFDISLYARSGPVPALAGRAIDLGPRSHVRLRLDALAEEQDLLGVHVAATSGRIAVTLRDVEVPQGDSPRGVDFIPRAVEPTTTLHISGIPGGAGARELVLVNPGSQFATVATALTTSNGEVPLTGMESVAIPAGSVVSIPITDQLATRDATLTLRSDVPVTGGVRSSWGTTTRDVSWLSATPALADAHGIAGAAAVPVGPDLVTTVTVAAVDRAVSGTLSVTLTEAGDEPLIVPAGDQPADEGDPGDDESGDGDSGPQLVTAPARTLAPIQVNVPAGTQQVVTVPDTDQADLATLIWLSSQSSGPVLLSHLSVDEEGHRATGYSWWPLLSSVPGVPVREDIGVLASGR